MAGHIGTTVDHITAVTDTVDSSYNAHGHSLTPIPNVPEPLWGDNDSTESSGHDSECNDNIRAGKNIWEHGVVSTPPAHTCPDHSLPATVSASSAHRVDTTRCRAFEVQFNKLVGDSGAYDVSEKENLNAKIRGIAVTRVPKFSAVLREHHATPVTIADLQFPRVPQMVGDCRMYRWYGSHRFLYVKVSMSMGCLV